MDGLFCLTILKDSPSRQEQEAVHLLVSGIRNQRELNGAAQPSFSSYLVEELFCNGAGHIEDGSSHFH